MRRLVVVAVCGLLLGACTAADAGTIDADGREDAMAESAHAPRAFRSTSDRLGPTVEVEGVLEDDYRYSATVAIDGRDLYEEVVIDDRRWIRILGVPRLGGDPAARAAVSELLQASAAAGGEWIIDAAGAPGEFGTESASERIFGPRTVLDVVRRLDTYTADGDSLGRLRAAEPYNPDSANYLERNDKFERHAADGERFDVIPFAYDAEGIFGEGVPANVREALEPYALYTSFWVEDGRITRIETLFDVDVATVERDLLAVHEAVAEGAGAAPGPPPEVPQPYRETLTFEYLEPAPRIDTPPTGVSVELPAA